MRIVDTAKDAFEPGGIAQFETIHPFLDGNGRIGRLLITLSLMNDHALSTAVFYPSYLFKLRRSEYHERLMGVREHGEYAAWVRFFCECLLASADDAAGSLMRLVELHNNNIALVNGMLGRSSANGLRLLELLEENPIVDVAFIAEKLEIARTTASNLVKAFVNLGILVQPEKERQRYRMFLYEDYLAILRQGAIRYSGWQTPRRSLPFDAEQCRISEKMRDEYDFA